MTGGENILLEQRMKTSNGENIVKYMEDELLKSAKEKYKHKDSPYPSELGFGKTLKSKLKKLTSCSSSEPKQLFLLRFPLVNLIRHYNLKENLISDIISGAAIAMVHLPQGLGYATLAYLHPISGIYMAFFSLICYSIFTSSRHCSMGSFAVVCLVTGKAVLQLTSFPDPGAAGELAGKLVNGTIAYSPIEVSTALCFEIAIFMFIFGFLNLGIMNVFLSDMVVSAFTTGAAVQVLTVQMRPLLGIAVKKPVGVFHVILTWKAIFESILETNIATLLISTICIVLLLCNEFVKPHLVKVTKFPIPMELTVVIGGTLASRFLDFNRSFDVQTVGEFPIGLPYPAWPNFDLLGKLVVPSLMISIVSFRMAFGMSKLLAKKNGYTVDPSQEFYAMAIGNFVGSFFQGAPLSASLSRSFVQESAGARTQLSSIISCCIVGSTLFFIGSFFETLPYCVLAAVIIASLKGLFKQIIGFWNIWKLSKMEGSVWLITFLGVIFLDIDLGLFLGAAVSFLMLIYKSHEPTVAVLGRLPNKNSYVDKDRYSLANEIPGVKILHVAGVLNFANSELFRRTLIASSGVDPKANKMMTKQDNQLNSKINDHLSDIKNIILDLSGVGRLDIPAAQNLTLIFKEYTAVNISLEFASLSEHCMEVMKSSEALLSIPADAFFQSIQDAVSAFSVPELQEWKSN